MNNATKNFDILVSLIFQLVWAFYIIILIVQQNYFSDLYPAKILDLSAKPFFPCTLFLSLSHILIKHFFHLLIICNVSTANSHRAKNDFCWAIRLTIALASLWSIKAFLGGRNRHGLQTKYLPCYTCIIVWVSFNHCAHPISSNSFLPTESVAKQILALSMPE